MLLGDSLRLARCPDTTRCSVATLRGCLALGATKSLHRGHHSAWGHWYLQILGGVRNDLFWEVRNLDMLGHILVALGDDLKQC